MTIALPKKVALRAEHTGDASKDRAQVLARSVALAHETTKAYVAQQAALLSRFMSVAAVPMGDVNRTLTAAQFACGTIIASGTLTAARTLSGFTRPASTTGVDWYWRFFWNSSLSGFSISLSDGTSTLSVGSGGQAAVVFTNTGPQVLR